VTAKTRDDTRRGRGRPTVAHIAQLAGVSAPTVSKVLNGRSGVGSETRRRVEALLNEHGYRRLATLAPAATIEVVFHGVESQLAIEVMRGVGGVARAHRLAAAFIEIQHGDPTDGSWTDEVVTRRPTGVIAVHSDLTRHHYAQFAACAIPLVTLDPTGDPFHGVPSVGSTNWSGGIAAARHLLDLGHRRIAAISGPPGYLCARARLEAGRAALDTAGTPIDPGLVRAGRFSFDDGLRLGSELLNLADPPTAVICGNDLQALGVYEAARRAGLRIPHDLSVIGYDDLVYTRWCGPPMTSVRQPFADMGAAAAQMVRTLAAGGELTPTRVELAATLVVRESTAPPRRDAG
jgi:LacI family xylobiose transport system transcriptional regulator